MSERYTVARLDEIDGFAEEGEPRWHMIRSALGIESFGVNAWSATEAGQPLIGDHDELGQGAGRHEEMYLVLSGRASFTVDGSVIPVPAGTIVFVKDPASRRSAVADEAGTTVLVIGGRPGGAFSISPWERSAEALRFWSTGDWQAAIDILLAQHAADPRNANLLYNLACAESRDGRTADALLHLGQAVELEPGFGALARNDTDFEGIRSLDGFPAA